jgi:hypothetical protein
MFATCEKLHAIKTLIRYMVIRKDNKPAHQSILVQKYPKRIALLCYHNLHSSDYYMLPRMKALF